MVDSRFRCVEIFGLLILCHGPGGKAIDPAIFVVNGNNQPATEEIIQLSCFVFAFLDQTCLLQYFHFDSRLPGETDQAIVLAGRKSDFKLLDGFLGPPAECIIQCRLIGGIV